MSAGTKTPVYKLRTNIPARMWVKFAAVYPGKEWEGKQLPEQLAFTGKVDGQDAKVYCNVAVLERAQQAGILGTGTPNRYGGKDYAVLWSEITLKRVEDGKYVTTLIEKYEGEKPTPNGQPKAATPTPEPQADGGSTDPWEHLERRAVRAMAIAVKAFHNAGVDAPDSRALHGYAATVLIASQDLPAPNASFDQKPAALDDDADADLPF